MNCEQAHAQLSAYFDGELPDDDVQRIDAHLAICSDCRARLNALQSISRLVRDTPMTAPANLWNSIASTRDQQLIKAVPSKRSRRRRWFVLGTAAALVVAAWLIPQMLKTGGDHHEMHAVFARFFDAYARDPNSANKIFLASYSTQQVNDSEAAEFLGGPSISRLPTVAGCTLRERHLISMPCCRCVQSVYVRKDGPPLIIFEHSNPQPDWFAESSSEEIPCPEGMVCKVNVNQGKGSVITFKLNSHHVTLVGANGVEEARAILREALRKT